MCRVYSVHRALAPDQTLVIWSDSASISQQVDLINSCCDNFLLRETPEAAVMVGDAEDGLLVP